MPCSLAHRQHQAEFMDAPAASADQLRRSLRFIQHINRFLGYTHSTLYHLSHFSRGWRSGQRIDILDLATGSADIPRAILRWADRRSFDVHILALDLHPLTTRIAGESPSPRLQLLQADALHPPFPDRSFDYVLTSTFLHHLDDPAVVQILKQMDRLARRGVIVADLLRHRRALAWVSLFTLWANPMLKHDARVSVCKAFTRDEILALRDQAGLGYAEYHRHFGHRFVLAGEKA